MIPTTAIKRPTLYIFKNEYREWFSISHDGGLSQTDSESRLHAERKLYMYRYEVGYCSSTGYHFRNETDRFIFLLKFGLT